MYAEDLVQQGWDEHAAHGFCVHYGTMESLVDHAPPVAPKAEQEKDKDEARALNAALTGSLAAIRLELAEVSLLIFLSAYD